MDLSKLLLGFVKVEDMLHAAQRNVVRVVAVTVIRQYSSNLDLFKPTLKTFFESETTILGGVPCS